MAQAVDRIFDQMHQDVEDVVNANFPELRQGGEPPRDPNNNNPGGHPGGHYVEKPKYRVKYGTCLRCLQVGHHWHQCNKGCVFCNAFRNKPGNERHRGHPKGRPCIPHFGSVLPWWLFRNLLYQAGKKTQPGRASLEEFYRQRQEWLDDNPNTQEPDGLLGWDDLPERPPEAGERSQSFKERQTQRYNERMVSATNFGKEEPQSKALIAPPNRSQSNALIQATNSSLSTYGQPYEYAESAYGSQYGVAYELLENFTQSMTHAVTNFASALRRGEILHEPSHEGPIRRGPSHAARREPYPTSRPSTNRNAPPRQQTGLRGAIGAMNARTTTNVRNNTQDQNVLNAQQNTQNVQGDRLNMGPLFQPRRS